MNSELERLLKRCTVKIAVPNQMGWGTGFLVAPGLLLTCAHVVRKLAFDLPASIQWQQLSLNAQVTQIAPQLDLALLQLTPSTELNLPCVYLDEAIESGDSLYFFGYPDEDFPNGAPVTANCEGMTGDLPPLIKFKQAQVRPGMSGSALLNKQTEKICGVVKFTRGRSSDLGGGAISTKEILEAFPQIRELQSQFHQEDKRWNDLIRMAKTETNASNRSITIGGNVDNSAIVMGDGNRVTMSNVTQRGKYNINTQSMSGVHIGDVIHSAQSQSDKSSYVVSDEGCQNRHALERYLELTTEKLKQHGCLNIREDVSQGGCSFSRVARIDDFELPFWPVDMRGKAFFVFLEYRSIEMTRLRQFSGQALRWAKGQPNMGAAGRAAYNARIPTHLCFAVAIADSLDEATKHRIRTTNPLDHNIDLMWYEVPAVYELSSSKLYFYDQPSGFFEQFKGEIVWKPLREVIQQLLGLSSESVAGGDV